MPSVFEWMLGADSASSQAATMFEGVLELKIADLLSNDDSRGLEKNLIGIVDRWLGDNAIDIARHTDVDITILLVDACEYKNLTIDLGMIATRISERIAPQMRCRPIIEMQRELNDERKPRSLNVHIAP